MNINIAEVSGYFTQSWIKDAIFANSCTPQCYKKDEKDEDEPEDEEDQTVHELDMGTLLEKMDDQVNLALWRARPSWGQGENKIYVEEDCPSFKEMDNRELFDDLDGIVEELKRG